MNSTIQIGDKIRISVDLLRMFYDQPDHQSPIVLVKSILDDDGVKILVLGVDVSS
jgi:hypothetical protein